MKKIKNTQETISTSKKMDRKYSKQKISPFGRLFRLIGWWFGFTNLYATFAVCPFCKQQGCPVGMASAGVIGAFFTLCVQDWKRFFTFIRKRIKRGKF